MILALTWTKSYSHLTYLFFCLHSLDNALESLVPSWNIATQLPKVSDVFRGSHLFSWPKKNQSYWSFKVSLWKYLGYGGSTEAARSQLAMRLQTRNARWKLLWSYNTYPDFLSNSNPVLRYYSLNFCVNLKESLHIKAINMITINLLTFYPYFSLHVHVCVDMCASEYNCLRKPEALASLELELQRVVNIGIWVLGEELRSPAKTICALHHWVITLAPYTCIFEKYAYFSAVTFSFVKINTGSSIH